MTTIVTLLEIIVELSLPICKPRHVSNHELVDGLLHVILGMFPDKFNFKFVTIKIIATLGLSSFLIIRSTRLRQSYIQWAEWS